MPHTPMRPAARGLWCALALLALTAAPLAAQTPEAPAPDSTAAPSVVVQPPEAAAPSSPAAPEADSTRTPRGALRRALLLPGWGQAYNGERAKVPFVIVGVLGAGAYTVYQHDRYLLLRHAFLYRQQEDRREDTGEPNEFERFEDDWIEAGSLPTGTLRTRRTAARSNRDIAVLVTGLVYAAQALDAYVSAELQGFDVSDDLTLDVLPGASGAPGLTLRATF